MEGGDDGRMDIAAVQALGREEKREFSWKEGRETGRRATEKERERATDRASARGNEGRCLCVWAPDQEPRAGRSERHSWERQPADLMRSWAAHPFLGHWACENPAKPGARGGHMWIYAAYNFRVLELPWSSFIKPRSRPPGGRDGLKVTKSIQIHTHSTAFLAKEHQT